MNDISEDSDFVKLEKTVEDVLNENNLQSVLYFSKIQKHWEIIVGKPLAAKTSPVQLIKKKLIVNVADAAYSHHLKYFERQILDLIASPEICGEGVVKKVSFKVGKTAPKPANKNPQKSQNRSKRISPQIDPKAQKTSENIGDRKLKASFSRLMTKRLSKKTSSS